MAGQFCQIDELHHHVHYDLDIAAPRMPLSPHDLNDDNSNSLKSQDRLSGDRPGTTIVLRRSSLIITVALGCGLSQKSYLDTSSGQCSLKMRRALWVSA